MPIFSAILFILLLQSTIVSTSFQRNDELGRPTLSEVVTPTRLLDFSRGKSDVRDLAVSQSALFVADGQEGLRAFNVTNSSLELIAVLSNTHTERVLLNDTLLFAKSTDYVHVIDVSNLDNFVSLANYSLFDYDKDLSLSKTTLYLVGFYGLTILDVSDPANLGLISELGTDEAPFFGSAPTSVVANGSILYVGSFTYDSPYNGIYAFNVSDPFAPKLISYFSLSRPEDLAVRGQYLFVAGSTDGFYAIDYSDPSNPVQAGNIKLQADTDSILIEENYAYVSNSYGGLSVIDISLPFALVEAARVSGDRYTRLAKRGDVLFVAREVLGVQAINVADPSNPKILFDEDLPTDNFQSAFYYDSKLFVANDREGMLIFSAKDFSNISQLGKLDVEGYVNDVKVKNGVAIIRENFAVTLANITNPSAPEFLSRLSVPSPVDVEFAPNDSIILSSTNGIIAYNISDPRFPSEIWSNNTIKNARVAVQNDTFIALSDTTAIFYDISNISNPIEYGYLSTEAGVFNDAVIVGGYAYIIQDNRLLTVDASDSAFSLISNTSIIVSGSIIESRADLVYILQPFSRFSIYNVSTPGSPEIIGAIGWNADAKGFAVNDNGTVIYLPQSSAISLLRYPPLPGWETPSVPTDPNSSSSSVNNDAKNSSSPSPELPNTEDGQKDDNSLPLTTELTPVLGGLGIIIAVIASRKRKT